MLKIQQQTAPQLEEEKKLPAMTTSASRQNIHRSISFSTHVPFVQFVCNHLFVERAGRVCLEEPSYSCPMTMTYLAAGSHGFLRAELFHGPHGVERLDVAACLSGGGAFPAVGQVCGLGGRCRRGRGGCPHPACGYAMAFLYFPKKTKCLTICMPRSNFIHIVTS
jgi:hypothetical protein